MRGELIVIEPNGTRVRRALADPDHFKDIVEAVGGDISLVPGLTSFDGGFCDAYVNAQSVLVGMPKNQIATELWWSQLDDSRRLGNALTILHGPVAIVTGDAEFIAASR